MDYEENFAEFIQITERFPYDRELQSTFIIRKIEHYMRCYEEEKTEGEKQICVQHITKLNNFYTDVLIKKNLSTLGLSFTVPAKEDLIRQRDRLFLKYKNEGTFEANKMCEEITRAFDFIIAFNP